MPSYSRRQLAVLLVFVVAAGAGLAIGRWRHTHPELVEQLEAFDHPPAESAPGAAPPSRSFRAPARKRLESPPAPAPSPAEPVDVNQATVSDLRRLPGIGPVLADRIVESRHANGPFTSIEDLRRVAGIGRSKLERFRDFVTVSR